jgi:hypothetical protein
LLRAGGTAAQYGSRGQQGRQWCQWGQDLFFVHESASFAKVEIEGDIAPQQGQAARMGWIFLKIRLPWDFQEFPGLAWQRLAWPTRRRLATWACRQGAKHGIHGSRRRAAPICQAFSKI